MAGVGTWAAYLITAMKEIKFLGARVARLETLEPSIGLGHDHDGGDGALIPEAGLHADVIAQLVTNGDSHDHVGGDGATIDTNALADNAVETNKINNLAVTAGKLATAVQNKLVTNGDSHDHIGGDGAEIDTGALASKAVTQAKIDDLAVDTGQLAAGAVETAKINNNAVDDTKVGNRVPQFYRREGGSSSDWSASGTSSYTPGEVMMECGVKDTTISDGNDTQNDSISYPASFGGGATVQVSLETSYDIYIVITSTSSSGFNYTIFRTHTSGNVTVGVHWMAAGPR